MTKQTTILFASDASVSKNEQLKQFVDHGSKDFSTSFIDGELSVVIKTVDEKKQTTDQVRMTAGAIARELSGRKVKEASIDTKELTEAFATLEEENVVTAFAEGWHLG